jgi:hypothetical protein
MNFSAFGFSVLENPVCVPPPRFVVEPSVKLCDVVPTLRTMKRISSPRDAVAVQADP